MKKHIFISILAVLCGHSYSWAETAKSFDERYGECFSDLQLLQSAGGTPRVGFLRGSDSIAVTGTDGKITVYTTRGATTPSTTERACDYSKETIADAIIKITSAVQDLKKPVDPKVAMGIGAALKRVKSSCAIAEPGLADYLNPKPTSSQKVKNDGTR